MPQFSQTSQHRLDTCHPDLRGIINEAIKVVDFSVLCGHRDEGEQNRLYHKGRDDDGTIVDYRKIVTYAKFGQSKHNGFPSTAIDIAPYPIDWNDIGRFAQLATIVKQIAKEQGVKIRWGGDFKKILDYPHFELVL